MSIFEPSGPMLATGGERLPLADEVLGFERVYRQRSVTWRWQADAGATFWSRWLM
jgi:hypothetical protein